MYCAISGEVPQQPVVSALSGHVFEQRLIEKALEASNGICPATGEPLEMKQLIPIKADLAVRPKPLTATSLPGLLATFQNEWDDVMLETHSLKQQLHATRKELSHALYQHDAACRVIARLVRERDEARGALAEAQHRGAVGALSTSASNGGGGGGGAAAMEVDGAAAGVLPEDVMAHMMEFWRRASKTRKKRVEPAGLAIPEGFGLYARSEAASSPALFVDASAATCLDVKTADGVTSAVVGSSGGSLALATRSAAAKKGSPLAAKALVDTAHAAGVRGVTFVPSTDLFATVGGDGLKVWKLDDSCSCVAGDFGGKKKMPTKKAALVSVAAHPTGGYVATGGADASWQLYAVGGSAARLLCDVASPAVGTQATGGLAFHPDGLILAAPASAVVRIYDIKEQKNVHTFEGHSAAVRSVAFSENGYYMASGADDATVRIWDLRKLTELKCIDAGAAVSSLTFDDFGTYVAYATTDALKVDVIKAWGTVANIPTTAATAVKFGPNAKNLWAAKATGVLDIFE